MKKRLSALILALAMLISLTPYCLAAEDEEVYEHVFPQWYNATYTVSVPVPEEYDMENEADAAAFGEWISSLCTENEDGSVIYRLDKATHEAWLETAILWIDHLIDLQLGEAPVKVEVAEDYSSFVITTVSQLTPIDMLLNSFPTAVAGVAITVLPLLGIDPEQISIRYIDGIAGTVMEEKSLLEHIEQYDQTSSEISLSDAYFDSSAMRSLGHFEEWLSAQGYEDVKTVFPPHMGIDTTADPNMTAGPDDFVISDELMNNLLQGLEVLEQFG